MRDQQIAFSQANQALSQLGIPGILPKLHSAGVFIKHFILGGSHSVVTYPPLDSLRLVRPDELAKSIRYGKRANLYVHIPFCETQCTFCHYIVTLYRGEKSSPPLRFQAVSRYLESLKREIGVWGEKLRQSGTAISSIYIGGGTPLILEQEQLHDLIVAIRSEFNVLPDAEICIEGSPLTVTAEGGEDKLRFLAGEGITRLSFGIQSFNDDVLKFAARGYKQETAIRACEIVGQVFDNWNLDLIQGLYKGTPEETWSNLAVIETVRPSHLTWYHGRFANRPQGDWYRSATKRIDFEDEQATLLGRMLIWQQMEALGYDQIDGNRFVREKRYTDPFKKIRTSVSNDLIGVGVSSYSHVDMREYPQHLNTSEGEFFRNLTNIQGYIESLERGDLPIGTGRKMDAEEWLAASYAVGLRTGRIEDETIRQVRKLNPELSAHYQDLETRLLDVGVLETIDAEEGAKVLRVSKLGQLFEDEVLSLFYSPTVQEALG
ncbi:MAG: radical SAM protein [bacterium]|nr:radical SAM protein [bacterium]